MFVLGCGGSPGGGAEEVEAARDTQVGVAEVALVFKSEGVRWIREERDRQYPRASPLDAEDRRRFSGFFPERILDRARVRVVGRFENPDFFSVFDRLGEPYPIDLRRASGLALIDTILVIRRAAAGRNRGELLFHELVHLVQYDVLGLEGYMDRYVDSWAENGRSYRQIPHERQAFELATRFRRSADDRFSVESAVRARFGIGAESDRPDWELHGLSSRRKLTDSRVFH